MNDTSPTCNAPLNGTEITIPPQRKLRDGDDDDKGPGIFSRIKEFFQISFFYTVADVRKRPRNTCIGILAVFLLVFFSGVVLVGIWKAPYVLLRLAELATGETDVILHGGGAQPLINFTELDPRIMRSPDVLGVTPRWILRAQLRNQELVSRLQRSQAATSTPLDLSELPFSSVNVIVVDSVREKDAGVGRAWPYRQTGYGESHVYYASTDYVGVRPNVGERINLALDAEEVSSLLGGDSSLFSLRVTRPASASDPLSWYLIAFFALNNITEDSVDLFDITSMEAGFTVIDATDGTYGKYSTVLGNAAVLDYKQVLPLLLDDSCLLGSQTVRPREGYYFPTYQDLLDIPVDSLYDVNLAEYAMMLVANFKDRYNMYYAEADSRNRKMTVLSNSLMVAAGLDFPGTPEFPLLTTLEGFDTFKVLLVSTFATIVICIAVLGSILMFALLRINAEERQFELAMLRAQGMPRSHISGVLIGQAVAFTLPGVIIGVCLVLAANAVLEAALANFTKAPARTANLPVVAGVISVLLGLLLPFFASYGPVKRALGGSLRDALDVYRQVQNESRVTMIKLEELGLATWQVLLGIFLVVAGFMIYYLMPVSFIFENMMMFFVLLDIILLCMVTGLCMMLYVMEPFMERLVLFLLLWGKERRLHMLISKNLRSHSERNSKAYMMFLLTIGCLTAAGVMFDILATISSQLTELTAGAQVTVVSTSIRHPLNQTALDAFLSGGGAAAYVEDWAYSSFNLNDYPQIVSGTRISNLVSSTRGIGVTALSENFQNAVYSDYMMVDKYNPRYSYEAGSGNKRDVVRSLYRDPARVTTSSISTIIGTGIPPGTPLPNVSAVKEFPVGMLVSTNAQDEIGLDIGGLAALQFSYSAQDGSGATLAVSTQFYLEPRALMNRVSGFFAISSLPLLFRSGSVLVSEESFRQLLNPTNMDFTPEANVSLHSAAILDVRQRTLYIKLRKGTTTRERNLLVNTLQMHTDTVYHTTVDTQATLDEIKVIQNVIMYFFYFTGAVCIVLCTFMMWLTFIANVQQNSWSLGVLRSLGFLTAQLMRAAVYEALCIVISAFILGFIIGMLIGATMALQLANMMVLPYRFSLPYPLIIIMLGLALIAAVVGSILPFVSLRHKAISSILRGGG